MKKITLFIFAISFIFSVSNVALAQENAMVIATVNIENAEIVSQNGSNFDISFDISNREGAQGQVKYGVMVLQESDDGQILADEKVYSEVISLSENSTIHRNITYQAPQSLNGKYQLWVISKNNNGLFLALNLVGEVELTSVGEYIEILTNTCFLKVEGEDTKYFIYQGVDIDPKEVLILTCDFVSYFNSDISLTPTFKTFLRSQFGKEVAQTDVVSKVISFKANEKKTLSFQLPKALEPQAYDLNMILKDENENEVSNTILSHYILRGPSATIQNLTFDKSFYNQGETAEISFFGTLSADSFFNSRGKETKMENVVTTIQITDKDGIACSEQINNPLTSSEDFNKFQVQLIKECMSPTAVVSIKDQDGRILDEGVFAVISKDLTEKAEPVKERSNNFIVLFVVLAIFVAILSIKYFNKRKIQKSAIMSILFISVFFGVFLIALPRVHADNFLVNISYKLPGEDKEYVVKTVVTVNKDKAIYEPNKDIKLSAVASVSTCANTGADIYLTAGYNSNNTTELIKKTIYGKKLGYTSFITGSAKINAPGIVGNYGMNLIAEVNLEHVLYGNVGSGSGLHVMPITVGNSGSSSYQCKGDNPENSILCPGDGDGLDSNNIQKTLKSSCSAPSGPKCEYKCKPGTQKVGNTCVPIDPGNYTCKGSDPLYSNPCPGDLDKLPSNNIQKTLKTSCSEPPESVKCEFICNPGYEKQGNNCKPIGTAFICEGFTPSVSTTNLCQGDLSGLTEYTKIRIVSACSSVRKCEYICKPGFVINSSGNNCESETECNDGIDNDGDGLMDENDNGCWDYPTLPSTYCPTCDSEKKGRLIDEF